MTPELLCLLGTGAGAGGRGAAWEVVKRWRWERVLGAEMKSRWQTTDPTEGCRAGREPEQLNAF